VAAAKVSWYDNHMEPPVNPGTEGVLKLIGMAEEERAGLLAALRQVDASDAKAINVLRCKLVENDDIMRKTRHLLEMVKRNNRPPEAGIPHPALSPNGPVPRQGGAAARLD